ncbi:hypothetical protein B0H17DRAFT_1126111 [Mycena rosella]|uniref:Uncharacterized protein n=1 Tax=Mycena rosella TaxID=1033263 RepID=A0AAD7GW48_MYCRO|nr:hypothetical protein B0H17DRAFT_1126111 [Mycena rosella]
MTSKRNRKKNNHNKAMAHSGELADDYQQPSGLTGDSSQSRHGDQGEPGSDNQLAVPVNQRESPGMADRGQISHDEFASTLSVLSVMNSGINTGDLSKNDASRNVVQKPLETNGGSGVPTENKVSKDSGIHTTSVKKKSQKATMEVVTDDEDIVLSGRRLTRPSRSNTTREGPGSTLRSVCSQMPPSSLPHPDDVNVCIAAEALARERGENEPPEEYNRRVATWKRNEKQLHELCKQDDFNVATELLEHDLQEKADHELTEAMACKEKRDMLTALEQAKSAQQAINREEAKAAAMKEQAAEKRRETNKQKQILTDYAHKKQASAKWIHIKLFECPKK